MLSLRRGVVVEVVSQHDQAEALVRVEVDGDLAEAVAQVALVGECAPGDEVIVNVAAVELGLGSGGRHVVHANLTRGLAGTARPEAHVMKLNYTSLQHGVAPVEGTGKGGREALPRGRPTGVLALHGQLAPVAFAFGAAAPGARLGYVQTAGGALPGAHSRVVHELRARGWLAGHLTAGPAFGGEGEAMHTVGAIEHGLGRLGWDAVVCGPGPGIVGSASALGHGGMVALDSAHAALALGCPTLLVARMSSGDARSRHRGLSHHTLTALDLLLAPVTVALPSGLLSPVGRELGAGLRRIFVREGEGAGSGPVETSTATSDPPDPPDARPARIARHDWRRAAVDLPGYGASGLPAETMGRGLAEDPLFFAAALAAGGVLAELATGGDGDDVEDEAGEAWA